MLLPLFQNNLLGVQYVYSGNVQVILSVPGIYQTGTDKLYAGNVQLISNVQAVSAVSFAYNGNVQLISSVSAKTLANFAAVGNVQLEIIVQATPFITATYTGSVQLEARVLAVPQASIDRRFTGHINLTIAVAASTIFSQQGTGLTPPGLIAIVHPPPTPARGLIAIPNPEDVLVPG